MSAERVERALVGHLMLLDDIDPPHLDWRNTDACRNRVHQTLARERTLVTPWCSICAAWRLVGKADVTERAITWHTIGTGQHRGRQIWYGRRVGAHISTL